ncbi:hypothetical protein [Alicyclobacillus acidoterrestris]|uniref:Uncharacterized protein n=1 Tax=Alicyclobacillus acidoterrestris (strain ATCC 49025 / DSM 3922 / CIP 106132 / NCIMB 13137 / GD3B) TaxID=1356854 RepID=A0A9E7CQK0_ALIAG|nr:hypothetical protein [Alicyclobacillus acidoterrestris]UNO47979.1 hypothetical protein K1I37_14995 [Alicyclobacillus acidoterrestris]
MAMILMRNKHSLSKYPVTTPNGTYKVVVGYIKRKNSYCGDTFTYRSLGVEVHTSNSRFSRPAYVKYFDGMEEHQIDYKKVAIDAVLDYEEQLSEHIYHDNLINFSKRKFNEWDGTIKHSKGDE